MAKVGDEEKKPTKKPENAFETVRPKKVATEKFEDLVLPTQRKAPEKGK